MEWGKAVNYLEFEINLIKIREDLHKIPEEGLKEFSTQKYILNILKEFACLQIVPLKTGILVEYSCGSGAYKLFRADMDALPVEEKTGVDFASANSGWMHACGHDMHMSILLGLIDKVVADNVKANLLFLFQPAEELGLGAKFFLESGLLDKYKIESVVALHVSPEYEIGQVVCKSGTIFATAQEFDFEIEGKSAHAAKPQLGKDALLAGCELVRKLQLLKNGTNRVCVGEFKSGVIRNVVSDFALVKGTHRSLTKECREELNVQLKGVAASIESEFGVKINLKFGATTSEVINNQKLFDKFVSKLPKGIEFIEAGVDYTAEDFGALSLQYPGLLFWLGVGVQEFGLHNGRFLPDSKAIEVGVNSFYCLI